MGAALHRLRRRWPEARVSGRVEPDLPLLHCDALLLAAWATWLGNVCNYLFLLMFIWIIQRWQIVPEERALLALFGENYTRYCAQVRRWL